MSYKKIRLEDEWVVERLSYFWGDTLWRPIIRNAHWDDSLEGCVNWWAAYHKYQNGHAPLHVENYRIRNTDTDEVIPCAALV